MHHVVCFGEILWDNFREGKKAGGAPMNVALHLHKQGIESNLISSVGSDSNGTGLTEYLEKQGMSTSYIQRHPTLPTGIVEVELDEKQQAKYTITEPVAWDAIKFAEDIERLVKASEALIFGSLACRSEVTRSTLFRLIAGSKFKVLDMNLRPPHFNDDTIRLLVKNCDLLKINEDELLYLENLYNIKAADIREKARQLSRFLKINTICITLGEKGALVIHDDQIFEHPGFAVEVADTVGAGDAFLATFVSNFLQKRPMEEVLKNACTAGAIVASKPGANPDYSVLDLEKSQLKRKDAI